MIARSALHDIYTTDRGEVVSDDTESEGAAACRSGHRENNNFNDFPAHLITGQAGAHPMARSALRTTRCQ